MPYFVKRTVRVEAVRWNGNLEEVAQFAGKELESITGEKLSIKTTEGTMTASLGDWIIKGVKGEFYPCKPDIFDLTYELVKP